MLLNEENGAEMGVKTHLCAPVPRGTDSQPHRTTRLDKMVTSTGHIGCSQWLPDQTPGSTNELL